MKEAKEKVKKPLFKRWWFWAIIVLLVIGMFSPKKESKTEPIKDEPVKTEEAPAVQEPEKAEEPEEQALSFVLMDDEVGDYGVEVVINEGTEFEEKEIAYYIPAGVYTVANLEEKGGGQITVYSGLPVKNGEWEEFVADENCASPIVVMAGEEKELEIKEGQFVVLSDKTSNIQFTLK